MTLDEIVKYSQLMLQAARDGEWERVVTMEETRRPYIQKLFGEIPTEDFLPWKTAAEAVLQCDRELEVLAGEARGAVAESVKRLAGSRQAVKQYTSNT